MNTDDDRRKRLLIFIVAYQAESTIRSVLTRIPIAKLPAGTEVLIIDDQSSDRTFAAAEEQKRLLPGLKVTVLYNPRNRRYGGNQKLGYHYAIENGFDVVALLHGDGQYAPESLPDLVMPVLADEADACFGSRMMTAGGARRGGMPLYKFIGNRILSVFQNRILGGRLSEFHSGYRVYSVKALKALPFDANTDDFHFDTEIIIQFMLAGLRILERPIPTYYGDEICRVNGMAYAANVARATLGSWFHQRGVFYQRKYDVIKGHESYDLKLGYTSSHTMALDAVKGGTRVLDLACAGGGMAGLLKAKGCRVTGVDLAASLEVGRGVPAAPSGCVKELRQDGGPGPSALPVESPFERYIQHDLDSETLPSSLKYGGLGDASLPPLVEHFDYILCLDCLEHLKSPERFLTLLRRDLYDRRTRLVFSTGNIGFIMMRIGLLLGQFNYGRQGILDLTHTRLFTFRSFRALLEQNGYEVLSVRGVPAPFPKALGDGWLGRALVTLNQVLIALSKGLFSYQIHMEAVFVPTLESLLADAEHAAEVKRARDNGGEPPSP